MEFALPIEHQERDLIEAAGRKERWAQKQIYQDHYSILMGVCLRYSNNEEDALDILHDGFIKVFRNIKKYQPGTSLTAWMVFNLYVIEGFSHREIADQLGITESTSRSNLVKARIKLKAILEAKYIGYGE